MVLHIVKKSNTVYNPLSVEPKPIEEVIDVKVTCPKCGSESAFFKKINRDITLECLCGLSKLVASDYDAIEVHHSEIEESISLPRKGTKLLECLGAVYSLSPATTADVTQELHTRGLEWTSDEVASFLTVLRYKGLVEVLESRRGITGGSTWAVTDITTKLMGMAG